MKKEDLATVRDMGILKGYMPYLEDELNSSLKRIENKVLASLEKGELSADQALSAWIEYGSYKRMLRKFQAKVRMGQSVGEKLAGELDLPE